MQTKEQTIELKQKPGHWYQAAIINGCLYRPPPGVRRLVFTVTLTPCTRPVFKTFRVGDLAESA